MDPTIEQILAVSDRAFLHGVLTDLCMENGFVRQAVLQRFTALPDGPSTNSSSAGNAAGGDQAAIKHDRSNASNSDTRNDIKPEASRGAELSLYDIPLAPSASSAPPAPSPPPASAPPEVYDLTNHSDIMVIDDDGPNDSGSEFHDDDADTLYHSGGDESDSDLASASDEDEPRPPRHIFPPTIFSVQEYTRPGDFSLLAGNKTRLNLYKSISDHIKVAQSIDKLTERLLDCKDPAYARRAAARLHRMELNRRACRGAIEHVLDAEDRVHAAEYDQAVTLAAAASGRYEARTGAPESAEQRLARVERERRQQVDRRVAEVREEADRDRRMSVLRVVTKQAADKGARWLKASIAREAREKRQWQAQKRKEEAAAKKAAREQRRRGRGQFAYSTTPSEVGSMMGNASD
ncbi:uncharacterized protein PG986_004094 [Apiospora aurea]|uniref:Uncharacterized protein n=1 Tax=Apiospora aurea TaxID=335848 RepID=A0ABR1QLL7_9PEZI